MLNSTLVPAPALPPPSINTNYELWLINTDQMTQFTHPRRASKGIITQFVKNNPTGALADALNSNIDLDPNLLNVLCSCLLERLVLSVETKIAILRQQALCLDRLQSEQGLTVIVRKLIDENPYAALREACSIHLQEEYHAYNARLCDLLAQDLIPQHLKSDKKWRALSIQSRMQFLSRQLVNDDREIYAILRFKESCYLAFKGDLMRMLCSLSESFFVYQNFFEEISTRYESAIHCPSFVRAVHGYIQRPARASEQLAFAAPVTKHVGSTTKKKEDQSSSTDLQSSHSEGVGQHEKQSTPTPPRAFLRSDPFTRRNDKGDHVQADPVATQQPQ